MVQRNQDIADLIHRIAEKNPDIVEFRLDEVDEVRTVEALAEKKTFPAIATDRSDREPARAMKLLLSAIKAGFEYVDIELLSKEAKYHVKQAKSEGAEVLVSFHDKHRTATVEELKRILDSERELGADICKIVTTAVHPRDNLIILEFLHANTARSRIVSFAMGAIGKPSRVLSPLFGAEFTFAALDEDSRTAEGQLTVDNLRAVWNHLGIS